MITAPRPPSVRSMGPDYGDPITVLMRPPAGESDSDKQLRLQREAEAKRISDSIDEDLRAERERMRKSKQDIRVRLHSALFPFPPTHVESRGRWRGAVPEAAAHPPTRACIDTGPYLWRRLC